MLWFYCTNKIIWKQKSVGEYSATMATTTCVTQWCDGLVCAAVFASGFSRMLFLDVGLKQRVVSEDIGHWKTTVCVRVCISLKYTCICGRICAYLSLFCTVWECWLQKLCVPPCKCICVLYVCLYDINSQIQCMYVPAHVCLHVLFT